MFRAVALLAVSGIFVAAGLFLMATKGPTAEILPILLFFSGCAVVAARNLIGRLLARRSRVENGGALRLKYDLGLVAPLTGAAALWTLAGAVGVAAKTMPEPLSWALLIFSGAMTCVGGAMIFDRRPQLVIDADGLLDRRISARAIPWREIIGVERDEGTPWITVRLAQPDDFLADRTFWARLFRRSLDPLRITDINLDGSAAEVMQAIRKFGL